VVCLERDRPVPRFFDTLKSEYSDGWETAWRCIKAHERRLRGSTRPRPRGESHGEVNAKRGSASRYRVTPACLERIPWMREPLKPRLEPALSWPTTIESTRTARREGSVERRSRYRGGKTSESGNPRALPARNKAGRLRAEQGVKRLRKPVGAAQPGEAIPVQVAARFWKRRRVTNPMEVGQVRMFVGWNPAGGWHGCRTLKVRCRRQSCEGRLRCSSPSAVDHGCHVARAAGRWGSARGSDMWVRAFVDSTGRHQRRRWCRQPFRRRSRRAGASSLGSTGVSSRVSG
jgi:hypothetical protein